MNPKRSSFFSGLIGWAGIGGTVGLLVAALQAGQTITSHQYLQSDLHRTALDTFAAVLTRGLVLGCVLAMILGLVCMLFLRRFEKASWKNKIPFINRGISAAHGLLKPGIVLLPLLILCQLALSAYLRFSIDPNQPNLVMISIDTLRADHLGCYGYGRDTSPRIDALARQSVFFHNAYTPWPKTTPAVTSTLTGQFPHTHGIMRLAPYQVLRDQLMLLPEVLLNEGYFTQAMVANPNIGRLANADQGFKKFAQTGRINQLAHASIPHLKKLQNRGKPFFFWAHYMDPHAPYRPKVPQEAFFQDEYYDPEPQVTIEPEPFEFLPVDDSLTPYERRRREAINRQSVGCARPGIVDGDPAELARYIALYDAEIRAVDQKIGRLLDSLEENGLLENTVLILWADHGESLGEHNYYFQHGRFAYNANLKIPLMIRVPGVTAKEIHQGASLIDLAPTVLDLLGIDHSLTFEGISLAPLVHEGEEPGQPPRPIFAESGYAIDFQKVLIQGDWKLIYYPDELDRTLAGGREFELYYLPDDPDETVELSAEHPQVLEEMKTTLLRWVRRWKPNMVDTASEEVEYSQKQIDTLRSLGYLN